MDSRRRETIVVVALCTVGLMFLWALPGYCAEQVGPGKEGRTPGIEVQPGGGIFAPTGRQVGSGLEGRIPGKQLPPGSVRPTQDGSGASAVASFSTTKPGVRPNPTTGLPSIPTVPKPGVSSDATRGLPSAGSSQIPTGTIQIPGTNITYQFSQDGQKITVTLTGDHPGQLTTMTFNSLAELESFAASEMIIPGAGNLQQAARNLNTLLAGLGATPIQIPGTDISYTVGSVHSVGNGITIQLTGNNPGQIQTRTFANMDELRRFAASPAVIPELSVMQQATQHYLTIPGVN